MLGAPPVLPWAYRAVLVLLWGLTIWNTLACRGLFWDGSSFLVNILDLGRFHDFYVARAHVDWLTQAPVLLLSRMGLGDTHLLSMVYSATLFALPTGLYHLALARLRHDALLLGFGIAIVAVVYLPTWFFIVGEYNLAFAAVTAAVAIALTLRPRPVGDAAAICLLGVVSVRSYEAMLYLGPLVAAVLVWRLRRIEDRMARFLLAIGALGFLAGAVVGGATVVEYWTHPHFVKVRSTALDFWQNLQFAIPVAALAACALISLARPRWLQGRGPVFTMGLAMAALALTPWYRLLDPDSILYPPAQYLARQAAGVLLAAMLLAMWIHVAWRGRVRPLATLALPAVSRRLVLTMTVLMLAAAVPDLALTQLWWDYLERMRALVDSREGIVRGRTLPLLDWPDKLFAQEWSLPAMSAIVSRTPGRAYVRVDNDYLSNPPFDPACGTLPRLKGYGWRS
ncbi:MAG: hypothetical protein JO339_01440 [Alphaproteobacteria bacterium]|nr:hypothetical protein [Alphaproteobacteria bacterium]